MKYNTAFSINGRRIALDAPSYFIADIAANHDGDLERAKALIYLAKEAGADAVKFQHFKAEKIVSDFGFKNLGSQLGHQSKWKKSVFEVYRDAECNRSWTEELVKAAKNARVDFFTTPYDDEALSLMDPVVPAYKIGSGDITWIEFIEAIACKGKPTILASGAATLEDVQRAVEAVLRHNPDFALMQCNTNYTGSVENFKYINLNVLKTYADLWPGMVLGLSDHTPGHATVLGAVALGARVIEKHFTDDNDRTGPDHPFSMNPQSWHEMVERTRELESRLKSDPSGAVLKALAAQDPAVQAALGDGVKRVEENELETVILQRRCLRLTQNLKAGDILKAAHLEALRPAPAGSYAPYELSSLLGQALACDKPAGDALMVGDVVLSKNATEMACL